MCAIIDNNVVHEAFGDRRTEAGTKFREWLDRGGSPLVVGGKLLDELDGNATFREWRSTAAQYGRVQRVRDQAVRSKADELQASRACKSNDHHVIALAQLSGARLLYSNDSDLHADFSNPALINGPRGRVYSTKERQSFGPAHRHLLTTAVCPFIGPRRRGQPTR